MMLTPAHSWSAVTMTSVSGFLSANFLAHRDRAVELDGVENPALGVHVVRLLVDRGALDHEHEAGRSCASTSSALSVISSSIG